MPNLNLEELPAEGLFLVGTPLAVYDRRILCARMSRGPDRDDRDDSRDLDTDGGRERPSPLSRWLEREPEKRKDGSGRSHGRDLSRSGEAEVEIHRLPERERNRDRAPERWDRTPTRTTIRHRGYRYRLRDSELETLTEIGRFRTVAVEDLSHYQYDDDNRLRDRDRRSLRQLGLVESHRVRGMGGSRLDVMVLSDRGRSLAARHSGMPNQRFFSGLVKPREAVHDAAIYRMFQAEADHIRREGGSVKRVLLDHELKSEVFGALERYRNDRGEGEDFLAVQQKIALASGLQVVDGKIPLPDLQIEYETNEGELARVNLELTTEHYKRSQIAAKASAGFKLYSLGGQSSGGRAVRDEREITSGILSL